MKKTVANKERKAKFQSQFARTEANKLRKQAKLQHRLEKRRLRKALTNRIEKAYA